MYLERPWFLEVHLECGVSVYARCLLWVAGCLEVHLEIPPSLEVDLECCIIS